MKKSPKSAQDLFLRLGSTPWTRSARADRLFRKLRAELDGELGTESLPPTPMTKEQKRTAKLAAE